MPRVNYGLRHPLESTDLRWDLCLENGQAVDLLDRPPAQPFEYGMDHHIKQADARILSHYRKGGLRFAKWPCGHLYVGFLYATSPNLLFRFYIGDKPHEIGGPGITLVQDLVRPFVVPPSQTLAIEVANVTPPKWGGECLDKGAEHVTVHMRWTTSREVG